jgi:hypothetical protein
MSKLVPGLSSEQMRALWRDFMVKTFSNSGFKVKFNGKTRTVFSDGSRFLVLDEQHGDVEIIKKQPKKGPAVYLGTQEIDPTIVQKPGEKVATCTAMKLGAIKTGKRDYQYELL